MKHLQLTLIIAAFLTGIVACGMGNGSDTAGGMAGAGGMS